MKILIAKIQIPPQRNVYQCIQYTFFFHFFSEKMWACLEMPIEARFHVGTLTKNAGINAVTFLQETFLAFISTMSLQCVHIFNSTIYSSCTQHQLLYRSKLSTLKGTRRRGYKKNRYVCFCVQFTSFNFLKGLTCIILIFKRAQHTVYKNCKSKFIFTTSPYEILPHFYSGGESSAGIHPIT